MRADVIPQLADAEQVLEAIRLPEDVSVSVLIPNERGLDRALAPPRAVPGDQRLPVRLRDPQPARTWAARWRESLAGLERVFARAREEGLRCEGVISTSFGCPYEGHVPVARVLEIAQRAGRGRSGGGRLRRHHRDGQPGPGARRSSPRRVRALPGVELTAHFHNTRGQGLANVLAALEAGVESFESSFGELGGCPVPAGATGNIATEDLVSMLHEMGICNRGRPRRADRGLTRGPAGARTAARQPRADRRAGGLGVVPTSAAGTVVRIATPAEERLRWRRSTRWAWSVAG